MCRYGCILVVWCVFMAVMLASVSAFSEPTYAEKLGWPAGSRVVIFHVDDAGMSHDSNMGAFEAIEKGVATSTSVMFPCPWVPEFAHYWKNHPDLDAGIHATLTSEWAEYRWGPLVGKKAAPGLVDEEGCLWHGVPQVVAKATPDEVEAEIRAQVERCVTLGFKPTHIDSHMGTVFANPGYLDRYIKIGIEMNIPLMFPGGHMEYISKERPELVEPIRAMAKMIWDAGLPVLDDIHTGGYGSSGPAGKKGQIIDFLRAVKPGITQFIVHCTRPTETFKFIAASGDMRFAELQAMTDPEVRKAVEEEKVILTTWKELKQRRDQVKAAEQPQGTAKP